MNLGQAIRRLRKQQGMTLAELADRCDSHVGNLSRIERSLARPSLELLYRLAEALDLSLTDIFSVAEKQQLDSQQVALNAAFISLLEADRQLLLEFAELLQKRSIRPMDSVSVGKDALPAEKPGLSDPPPSAGRQGHPRRRSR
ncbi:helix-turn-helix domain-containing protein [Marinobacter subterrani]|uniref:Transcriptional regulator, contains XRE-family HTH domain n=1 Tax=Marinobacter subterrani TaxID=1658765 RepID=A0A0J7LW25_9GAMM|nr:helix-turn-helix transcriptional regulator [Marinobacter subterrani]KMQ73085.1 Transcriptional regulator, contains XRE-family HTH domain [Marinobacter subterrani]